MSEDKDLASQGRPAEGVVKAALTLDGSEYTKEGSRALFDAFKRDGLVAVFGASDDLMEFRGAINDEVGCFGGGTVCLTSDGLLESECDEGDDCPYFQKAQESACIITANWDDDGFSWTYTTRIPHATFVINEDGEPYCRGIVFALADATPTAQDPRQANKAPPDTSEQS